jgi:HEAT repeat protein
MRTSLGLAAVFLLFILPTLAWADDDAKEIGGKSLDQWIKEIKDKDPAISENAIRTVIMFGRRGAKAAPALIDQLNHPDPSVKGNAAASLGILAQYITGADAERAIERLAFKMTEDRQAIVAYHSAMALYYFGSQSRTVIPKLILATRADLTWELRRAAVMALGIAGASPDGKAPHDPRAVKALVEATSDKCAMVRLEAVSGLGMCGPPNMESDRLVVLHALQHRFKDSDEGVIIWAHAAYLYIDKMSEEHLSIIASYLKSPKLNSRFQAAKALGLIGKDAKHHVSQVVDLLKDKEPIAAFAAAGALPNMGPGAAEAIPVMTELLQKKDLNDGLKTVLQESLKAIQGMKGK